MVKDDYSEHGLSALRAAYSTQRELSSAGNIAEFVSVGRGADKATKGDWESEEAVLNYFQRVRFPVRVIAEEHGTVDIVPNPRYLE